MMLFCFGILQIGPWSHVQVHINRELGTREKGQEVAKQK